MLGQSTVGFAFNPSTWEADAGGLPHVRAQPGSQNEFQAKPMLCGATVPQPVN